jgi:hypothetical protein
LWAVGDQHEPDNVGTCGAEENHMSKEHCEGLCVDRPISRQNQQQGSTYNETKSDKLIFPTRFLSKSQGTGEGSHVFLGISIIAIRDVRTVPKEKDTESAVTRYSLPRSICSKRRVLSVGNEPFQVRYQRARVERRKMDLGRLAYPTAPPRKNRPRLCA